MKRKNAFKSALLGGVSAAAVTAMAGLSQAQAANLTLGADGTWASNGGANSTPTTDVTNAAASDNVDITADNVVLTVTNDGTANDGSANVNTFVLGAITDSTPGNNGALAITTGSANDLTVTLGSVAVDGNVTVTGAAGYNAVAVTNNGALTVGGNFSLNHGAANTATEAMTWTQTGNATVTGTTAVTAGTASGNNATLTLNGAANTFTGAVTVTGGGHADADAKIVIGGAAATFNGGLILDDRTGQAILEISGSANQTVTGAISAAQDGEGDLVINNDNRSVTIANSIGSSSAALRILDRSNANLTFNGDVYIKTINQITTAIRTLDFNGDVTAATALTIGGGGATFAGDVTAPTLFNFNANGTMVFDGTSAQTVTGAITSSGASEGEVNVQNSQGVTFTGSIGAGVRIREVAVGSGFVGIFKGAIHADTIDFDGTVTLTENGNTAAVAFEVADTARFTLGGGIVAGDTVVTGTLSGPANDGTPNITMEMPVSFTSGEITFATAGGANMADEFDPRPNALATYTGHEVGGAVKFRATPKSAAQTASELGISMIEATALANAGPAAGAAGDVEAADAMTAVAKAGGAGAVQMAEQVSIQADTLGAVPAAAIGTGARVFDVASSRLASLRSGGQHAGVQTGFASGDGALARAVWMKPFGTWIRQDTAKNSDGERVKGYDADTYGVALGIDTELDDGVRAGASLAYSQTAVNGKGTGSAGTDIESFQVTVYGDYTADKYYVEGMLGHARNTHETSRRVTFGGLNRTAIGDYGSNQYMFKVGGGVPVRLAGDAFLTPTGSLSYTHVSSGSYTERGASGLNLRMTPDDVSALVGSLGAKVHARIKQGAGHLIPSATLGASYDFSGDEATATGRFTGGGSAFVVEGAEVEQLSGNAGLGLTYDNAVWSVSASYDAEARSDYIGHSATLEARLRF